MPDSYVLTQQKNKSGLHAAGDALTLLLLGFAIAISQILRVLLPILGQPIIEEFGLSDTMFSLVQTLPSVTYIAFALMTGLVLVWRKGLRTLLVVLGLLLSSLSLFPLALATNFSSILLNSFCSGAGSGMITVAALSLAILCVPTQGISVGAAVIYFFTGIGSVLAILFVVPLIGELHWRSIVIYAGLVGAIIALLLLSLKRERTVPRRAGWTRRRSSHLFVAILLAAVFVHVGILQSFSNFLGPFLTRQLAISFGELGLTFAINNFCLGFGAMLAALFASAFISTIRSLVAVFFVCVTLSYISLAYLGLGSFTPLSRTKAEIVVYLVSLFGGGWFGITLCTLVKAVHVDRAPLAIGLLAITSYLAGRIATPLFTSASWRRYPGTQDANSSISEGFLTLSFFGLITSALLILSLIVSRSVEPHNNDEDCQKQQSKRQSLLAASDEMPVLSGTALKGFGISIGERVLIFASLSLVCLVTLPTIPMPFSPHYFDEYYELPFLVKVSVVGISLFAFLGALYFVLRGLSARSKRHLQKELTRQKRNFVLYLRPFAFDLQSNATMERLGYKGPSANGTPVEEALGALCLDLGLGMKGVGPVDGQFGVDAVPASDREWKETVSTLMTRAEMIVMVPGPGEGCMWEINHILSHENIRKKAVWLMPPSSFVNDDVNFVEFWNEIDRSKLGGVFPIYNSAGEIFELLRIDGGSLRLERRGFSFNRISQLLSLIAPSRQRV